jgi:hypothetical protein
VEVARAAEEAVVGQALAIVSLAQSHDIECSAKDLQKIMKLILKWTMTRDGSLTSDCMPINTRFECPNFDIIDTHNVLMIRVGRKP